MSQYIDRKEAQKSYRPVAGSMSAGLKRAREPYRLPNAILGLALGAFAVGVWAYSIGAVKQDVFDDVDEEAKALSSSPAVVATPPTLPATESLEAVPTPKPVVEAPPLLRTSGPRGVLQHLDSRLPWLLDPQRKTIVWGAPPVDSLGKTSSK